MSNIILCFHFVKIRPQTTLTTNAQILCTLKQMMIKLPQMLPQTIQNKILYIFSHILKIDGTERLLIRS